MKLFREPLLHFLLIGALIYAAYGWLTEPAPETDNRHITVTAGEQQWMRDSWQKRWNRAPTEQEFDGLIQQYVKETVLYREALTMGLNQHDPVIRRRLAQKLEFLASDLATLAQPSDAELRAYFKQRLTRYSDPARYTFTQVYLDSDQRGDATLDDARRLKAELSAASTPPADPGALGDRFMLQNYFPQKDRFEIARLFGGDFADALTALQPGQWHGPVLSGYGMHLVYIDTVSTPPPPDFAALRERVQTNWETDRGEELRQQFFDELRARYTVDIEPTRPTEHSAGAAAAAADDGGDARLAGPVAKR